MTVKANSGILLDDNLDRARGEAMRSCPNGLPEPLVYYLRALEDAYLNMVFQQRRKSAQEIGWKHEKAA